ncbi:hypothetical protein FQZ97_915440 [compost metagenome]
MRAPPAGRRLPLLQPRALDEGRRGGTWGADRAAGGRAPGRTGRGGRAFRRHHPGLARVPGQPRGPCLWAGSLAHPRRGHRHAGADRPHPQGQPGLSHGPLRAVRPDGAGRFPCRDGVDSRSVLPGPALFPVGPGAGTAGQRPAGTQERPGLLPLCRWQGGAGSAARAGSRDDRPAVLARFPRCGSARPGRGRTGCRRGRAGAGQPTRSAGDLPGHAPG